MIGLVAVKGFLSAVPRGVWLALIGVLLVWLAYTWAYHCGEAAQEAKTQAVQDLLDVALEANRSNQDTIEKLEAANKELAEGREVDRVAGVKAVEDVAKMAQKLAQELQAEKTKRGRIYATNPQAAQVGATVVPDALVDGLRD